MAEYVRRRRPPANHPYWGRLSDRANPPAVLRPIAVPTFIGLALGLYAGLSEKFTFAACLHWASLAASTLGGLAFAIGALVVVKHSSRQFRGQQLGLVVLAVAVLAGLFTIMIGWVCIFVVLAWYSLSSGQGPWLGMLIAAAIPGVPSTLWALVSWRNWRERQRRWPRWEQMRAPRARATRTLPQLAAPTDGSQPESTSTVAGEAGVENRG